MFWTRFSVEKDQMPGIIIESQFAEAFDESGHSRPENCGRRWESFYQRLKQWKYIYVHDFEDLIFKTIYATPQWL